MSLLHNLLHYLLYVYIKIEFIITNLYNYIPKSKLIYISSNKYFKTYKYLYKNKYYNIKVFKNNSSNINKEIEKNIKMKNLITNICIVKHKDTTIINITSQFREYIHYFTANNLESSKIWKIILNDLNLDIEIEKDCINIVCGISLNFHNIYIPISNL